VIGMGLKRPSWFHPVRGPGEWVAFLAGIALIPAFLALVAWNVVRLADGQETFSELVCVDPTDPCNWSSYRVLNDTGAAIVLRECDDRCQHVDRRLEAIVVPPGATTVGEEVRATVESRNWWEVRTQSGRLLGCLVLDGHAHKRDGDVVRASSLAPCSSGRTTAVASA
jgi:hypothetical protein